MEASELYKRLEEQANEEENGTIQVSEYELAKNLGLELKQVHEALVNLSNTKNIKIVEVLDRETRAVKVTLLNWVKQEKKQESELDLLGEYMYKFTEGTVYKGITYFSVRRNKLEGLYGYPVDMLNNGFLCSLRYKELQCKIFTSNPNIKPEEKSFYEKELARLDRVREEYFVLKRTKTPQN